ncbi:hypothetical protein GCM10023201_03010 [Actinomycetospora corticicola]
MDGSPSSRRHHHQQQEPARGPDRVDYVDPAPRHGRQRYELLADLCGRLVKLAPAGPSLPRGASEPVRASGAVEGWLAGEWPLWCGWPTQRALKWTAYEPRLSGFSGTPEAHM